jgi:hypothetical protein
MFMTWCCETPGLPWPSRPLFEAGFTAQGAIVFVDLLLPEEGAGQGGTAWRLVEVKSSGSVKPYHWDDLAVQVHVLRSAGVNMSSAAVACVDTGWTYPGGGRYAGEQFGQLIAPDLCHRLIAKRREDMASSARQDPLRALVGFLDERCPIGVALVQQPKPVLCAV